MHISNLFPMCLYHLVETVQAQFISMNTWPPWCYQGHWDSHVGHMLSKCWSAQFYSSLSTERRKDGQWKNYFYSTGNDALGCNSQTAHYRIAYRHMSATANRSKPFKGCHSTEPGTKTAAQKELTRSQTEWSSFTSRTETLGCPGFMPQRLNSAVRVFCRQNFLKTTNNQRSIINRSGSHVSEMLK